MDNLQIIFSVLGSVVTYFHFCSEQMQLLEAAQEARRQEDTFGTGKHSQLLIDAAIYPRGGPSLRQGVPAGSQDMSQSLGPPWDEYDPVCLCCSR